MSSKPKSYTFFLKLRGDRTSYFVTIPKKAVELMHLRKGYTIILSINFDKRLGKIYFMQKDIDKDEVRK